MLIRIGAGWWRPGSKVAVCAGAGPWLGTRPEVKVQDGDVIACGVGLVFNILGTTRYARWSKAMATSVAGGVQNGGPPG